jgi:hypothetical protein
MGMTCSTDEAKACRLLMGKPKGKGPYGKPRKSGWKI